MHARCLVCDMRVCLCIMGEGNILDRHGCVHNECVQCVMGLLASLYSPRYKAQTAGHANQV